mmetsp:Transcript_95900/g.219800  ORF Transcript_95900/g.219800 Transcript_95900/m.219800 type:complete len:209 (-) Transcript_95900:103-729(-)
MPRPGPHRHLNGLCLWYQLLGNAINLEQINFISPEVWNVDRGTPKIVHVNVRAVGVGAVLSAGVQPPPRLVPGLAVERGHYGRITAGPQCAIPEHREHIHSPAHVRSHISKGSVAADVARHVTRALLDTDQCQIACGYVHFHSSDSAAPLLSLELFNLHSGVDYGAALRSLGVGADVGRVLQLEWGCSGGRGCRSASDPERLQAPLVV